MTAAFALAMVLVLVAAGLFVYLRLRGDLDESVNNGLRSRADDLAALIEESEPDLAGPGESRLVEAEESFAQVLTPSGRLVDASGGARGPAISPEEAAEASRGAIVRERPIPGVERSARLVARQATSEGRALVVVAGASLDDREETLAGVVASFAVGGPIAVLIASGLGYLLATAGLAPVEAMRRRAGRVSLSRAGERLPLPTANDEIRQLGETLNEMLARLEASFERERRFVADASHELRTPLAVLKTEIEAALRNAGPGAAERESLVAALEEADHLAQLADDLLLLARAGDGGLPVKRESVDVRRLLEQGRDRFVDRAHERGREIRVHAPEGLEAPLDPLRLRQALGNLVENALRHGEGDVDLKARAAGDRVEIDVSDHGPGFADEFAPRAFERFARHDSARTRGGSGLGLAIVRAIAEAHGGSAEIAPPATVRLRLPL